MAKKYLDDNGLLYVWSKIKALWNQSIKGLSVSGRVITYTKGDGTTGTITTQDTVTTVDSSITSSSTNPVQSSAIYTALDNKVDKVSGKDLSTNDYTTTEKNKLSGIASGAEVNQNAYSHFSIASSGNTLSASSKTDTLRVLFSSPLTAAVDDANSPTSVTIGLDQANTSAATLGVARKIDGVSFNGSANIIHYGECLTAAATTTKSVDCTGFGLVTGAWIAVKFTVTNTGAVASLKLNVNATGDKAIKYRGANLSSAGVLAANRVYLFVYDGTNYELVGDLDTNTTYTNASLGQGYGTCSTAAATAAKTVTLSDYALVKGGVVAVKFTNAITSTSSNTLNVNSKGAKSIYYKGAALTDASVVKAGDTVTFIYDGTNYHIISIDSAQENELAFKYVSINGGGATGTGTITPSSGFSGEGFDITAGTNVSVTSDTSTRTITIAATDTNTTYTFATGDSNGQIKVTPSGGSAQNVDVKGLGSLAYLSTVPVATSNAVGGVKSGGDITVASGGAVTVNGFIPTSAKGAASGVCPLNASSKIDSSYLPSYVDDVIEAYPVSGATALASGWLSATSGGSALTPETGKIYVLMSDSGDYSANSQFRWSGTTYVKLADGGVTAITNAEIDTICA